MVLRLPASLWDSRVVFKDFEPDASDVGHSAASRDSHLVVRPRHGALLNCGPFQLDAVRYHYNRQRSCTGEQWPGEISERLPAKGIVAEVIPQTAEEEIVGLILLKTCERSELLHKRI